MLTQAVLEVVGPATKVDEDFKLATGTTKDGTRHVVVLTTTPMSKSIVATYDEHLPDGNGVMLKKRGQRTQDEQAALLAAVASGCLQTSDAARREMLRKREVAAACGRRAYVHVLPYDVCYPDMEQTTTILSAVLAPYISRELDGLVLKADEPGVMSALRGFTGACVSTQSLVQMATLMWPMVDYKNVRYTLKHSAPISAPLDVIPEE